MNFSMISLTPWLLKSLKLNTVNLRRMNAERQGFTQRGVDFNMKSSGRRGYMASVRAGEALL